eukprot:9501893-Pyramimonas_sp.AAC.1
MCNACLCRVRQIRHGGLPPLGPSPAAARTARGRRTCREFRRASTQRREGSRTAVSEALHREEQVEATPTRADCEPPEPQLM